MEERKFLGIWIPANIWLDKRLNAVEKMILLEIASLDNEKGCIASNKYLAEFCQVSESKITKSITKLTKLGYLQKIAFDGRIRTLKAVLNQEQIKLNKIKNKTKKIKRDYEEREYTKEELLSVVADLEKLTEEDL